MTILLGAMLAAGILLMLSPRLWPLRERAPRPAGRPGRVESLLAAAGYGHVRPRIVWVTAVFAGVVAAAIAWIVVPVPALAALAAAAGALAPFAWLGARRRRLIARRRGLWPDVCELVIGSVRAGMSLPDAVAALGASGPSALRSSFATFARDIASSGHFDSSVLRLKDALADPVADRIIETLRMARQVGGTELVPVLRSLATAVRAETTVRAEVEARQSWTRGAAILGVVAPWVVLALLAVRPEGAAAYASPEGVTLIVGGAIVSIIAYRLMARVGRLREPRRWFG